MGEGVGLERLLGDRVVRLPVEAISAAPGQARRAFDGEALEALARSIAQYGLLSPVAVRRVGSGYQLIAGERRLRAVKLLGEKTIAALIRPADEREAALLTLIENVQREQLSYLEVAQGLQGLIESQGFSQQALGRLLGMSQPWVANKLRLLKLPPRVRAALAQSGLSERHARALLKLGEEEKQLLAVDKAVQGGYSVQQMEALTDKLSREEKKKPAYRIHLRDHRMLVNAVLGVVKSLNQAGVAATSRVQRYEDRIEVVVSLPVGKG